MMEPTRIAVAGCGVAGLAAALFLTRDGHHVTVFDQLSAPAPLGSGLLLQPAGLAVIEELGLTDTIGLLGQRIDALHGRAMPSDRVVLDVRYSALGADTHAIAIHRAALFHTLLRAANQSGITIETGCRVEASDARSGGRTDLLCDRGRRFGPFDLIVDALGIKSPLAAMDGGWLPFGALWANVECPARATVSPHALTQRYRRASQMAGILPIGRPHGDAPTTCAFFWSLRARDFETWRAQPLDAWRDDVASLWPEAAALVAGCRNHEDFVFARYRHRTLRRPYAPGVVHIGDAAHATSPQLGQGANMALLDASALASALRATRAPDLAAQAYARARARHIRLYQGLSYALTPLYQSDSAVAPLLRDRLFAPLARIWPMPAVLAALVSGSIGLSGPSRPGRSSRAVRRDDAPLSQH